MLFTSLSTAFVKPVKLTDKDGDMVGTRLHLSQKVAMVLDVAIGATFIVLALLQMNPLGLTPHMQWFVLGGAIVYTASSVLNMTSHIKVSYCRGKWYFNEEPELKLEEKEIEDLTGKTPVAAFLTT